MLDTVGQIFGWLSAIFGFIAYQCKTQKQVLVMISSAGICMCISYLLLGAYSGMLLNIVGLFRNIVYYARDKRIFSYKWWPPVLATIMGITGLLSWQGPVSLLIVIALALYTLVLATDDVHKTRKCILLTSTMVMLYNIYYHVWGAALFELISIASAVIGLIRYRNPAKENAN